MQDTYVDMQDIYVYMKHNYVDKQENCIQIKIIKTLFLKHQISPIRDF